MIICTFFDGDNDEVLKMFQYARYNDSLSRWVRMTHEKLQQYEGKSAGWNSLLLQWKEQVSLPGCFDHRCIQGHHDLIAARHRKLMQEMTHVSSFRKKDGWRGFFNSEAATWLDQEGTLRLFVTALACNGTDAGYDAEDELYTLMQTRFGLLDVTSTFR